MAKSPKSTVSKRVSKVAKAAAKKVSLIQDPVAVAHSTLAKRYAGNKGVTNLRKDTRVAGMALLALEATDVLDII
tara:strand:- start:871 stop:1095 length:225 start_codon:yes stop_codon:yes gene_type:complete